MTTPTNAYRILKISDPRSRGACYWFEIEGMTAAGERWHVATVDTRAEARQLVAAIEADDARRAAEALTLAPMEECPPEIDDADPDALTLEACTPELATIDVAGDLDRRRRTAAVRLATARAVADTLRHRRDDHAGRLAAARELAAAVAQYDAAWNDDSDFIS
jgi:hypothetical protein